MPTPVTPAGQPFTIWPELTRIAMAVEVDMMIADAVCPRAPVNGERFSYTKLDTKERFQVPDTAIGRTGYAKEVDFSAYDEEDRVIPHGLATPVPVSDIATAEQAGNYDPREHATVASTELMLLAREKRVATLLQTVTNYPAANRDTLDNTAGKEHFDNYAAGDPVAYLTGVMDGMLIRPNTLTINQTTWSKLKFHPEVVKKVHGVIQEGSVTREQLAEVLEIEQVLVGKAWEDTAPKGKAMAAARIWGNVALLHRLNTNLQSTQTVAPTFSMSATWKDLQVISYLDQSRGVEGCEMIKPIQWVKELISWSEAGFIVSNALLNP